MILFLDSEFDGVNLLSIALVPLDGSEPFYSVVDHPPVKDQWVKENVVTILNKAPVPFKMMQLALFNYLDRFKTLHFVCNHPIDLVHLNNSLNLTGGDCYKRDRYDCSVIREVKERGSALRHNCLEDAKAMRQMWLSKNSAIKPAILNW